MANIPESDVFPEGVYQIETTDPVLGGAPNEATGGGLINIPLQHLARRTRWLKARVDELVETVEPIATKVEAEAGAANDRMMTPLRVKQAVTALIGGIATSAGFAVSLATNGYIKLPTWLGGLTMQWGRSPDIDATGFSTFTFPIAFSAAPFVMLTGERTVQAAPIGSVSLVAVVYDQCTSTTGKIRMVKTDGTFQAGDSAYWLALGY